jgi:putative FmdB family regulatory protein
MPLYEYACQECGHRFEVRQGIREDPLTTCPTCGGAIRRVVQPVGIVFKGSGFYKTDSRSSSAASVSSSESKNESATSAGTAAAGTGTAAASTNGSSDTKSSSAGTTSSSAAAPGAGSAGSPS